MTTIGTNSIGNNGHFFQQYERSNEQVSRSLERLSTGTRINRASDDPAGFVVAEGLRGDLVELRAESRVADAERSQLHRNQSNLASIQGILTDLRGSLVTAADGTNTPRQSHTIQQKIDASLDAIDRIASGSADVSDSAPLNELRTGGAANVVDGDIAAATNLVDGKISQLSRARTTIAAYERAQLDTFERLREEKIVITTETLSQVEDTDFATEATNLVQGQILSKAAIAALTFSTRAQKEQLEALLEGLDAK